MVDHPHPQYEVTRQTKGTEPDGRGGYGEVWTIYYTTPSGTDSYVKVPASQYTAANVHSVIDAELQQIEGVHALGNGPPPGYTP